MRNFEISGGANIAVERTGRGWRIHSTGNSSGTGGYRGMFLAVKRSDGIRIVNGGAPDSAECGVTDLGGVAAATLTGGADKNIYLVAVYNAETKSYDQNFAVSLPDSDNYAYWLIASTDADGNPVQLWQDNVIYFSTRYIT